MVGDAAEMRATAFLVGPNGGPADALKQLARQLGFAPVYVYRSVGDAERLAQPTTPVFFLFGAVDSPGKMSRVVTSIRGSATPRIRFAPMIYLSDSPSLEVIRDCLDMGFDDIITLPFTLRRLEDRLQRQMDHPCTY